MVQNIQGHMRLIVFCSQLVTKLLSANDLAIMQRLLIQQDFGAGPSCLRWCASQGQLYFNALKIQLVLYLLRNQVIKIVFHTIVFGSA